MRVIILFLAVLTFSAHAEKTICDYVEIYAEQTLIAKRSGVVRYKYIEMLEAMNFKRIDDVRYEMVNMIYMTGDYESQEWLDHQMIQVKESWKHRCILKPYEFEGI